MRLSSRKFLQIKQIRFSLCFACNFSFHQGKKTYFILLPIFNSAAKWKKTKSCLQRSAHNSEANFRCSLLVVTSVIVSGDTVTRLQASAANFFCQLLLLLLNYATNLCWQLVLTFTANFLWQLTVLNLVATCNFMSGRILFVGRPRNSVRIFFIIGTSFGIGIKFRENPRNSEWHRCTEFRRIPCTEVRISLLL